MSLGRAEAPSGDEIVVSGPVCGRRYYKPITVEDILATPELLSGKKPTDIEPSLGVTSAWHVEALGRGAHAGEGWVLREYNVSGEATGRVIRWHPGGGRHGPPPYWRVSSPEHGKSAIIVG